MPTQFKLTTRRGFRLPEEIIRKEMEKELAIVADQTLEEFRKVVANWSSTTKPKFQRRLLTRQAAKMTLGIELQGDQHQKDTWKQLDTEGREGGTVVVAPNITQFEDVKGRHGTYQTRKLMRFRKNYASKTRPVAQYGGSGRRSGAWQRRSVIIQGAVEPRLFSKTIMDTFFRPEFRKAARRAYRRVRARISGSPQV